MNALLTLATAATKATVKVGAIGYGIAEQAAEAVEKTENQTIRELVDHSHKHHMKVGREVGRGYAKTAGKAVAETTMSIVEALTPEDKPEPVAKATGYGKLGKS